MSDPFKTYGSSELCGWRVESLGKDEGIFWLQTSDKAFARKLGKRQDTKRVENYGWNHFRQTYEMRGSWRKVKRLIDRYILSAGDCISAQNAPQDAPNLAGRVMTIDVQLSAGDCVLPGTSALGRVAMRKAPQETIENGAKELSR
jgi:hypothetical protein